MGKSYELAKYATPRITKLTAAAYNYVWTKQVDHLLPDHYKKRAIEFMLRQPKAVHWVPDERKYAWTADKKRVERVQNVPIPVLYPKEANKGLWSGEGIVQGFSKKSKMKPRIPKIWKPVIFKEALYSEILDQWMSITVTKRTLRLIDEMHGFDNYILGTHERDLNSMLAMKLRRQMLLALARKSLYPYDPDKREKVLKKYKKYEIPEEEAEWVGLTVAEALQKGKELKEKQNPVIPLKEIFLKQLLQDLKDGKVQKEEGFGTSSWREKLNPFKKTAKPTED